MSIMNVDNVSNNNEPLIVRNKAADGWDFHLINFGKDRVAISLNGFGEDVAISLNGTLQIKVKFKRP